MRADIVLFIQYGEQPTRYALFQNYPNPFNATTTLHYDVPEISQVTLTIYDILGREVITLVKEEQNYGYKKLEWGGKDQYGNLVVPGIYFYRAVMGPLTETKKMVLLK
jgi:flagellar hook assembly protein FlgD